jgi:beta-ureidopropionase / N-carbamoyl-L-amino-acid hydrolase
MLTRRELLALAAATVTPRVSSGEQLRRAAVGGAQPPRDGRTPAIDAARLRARIERLSTFGRPTDGTFESGVSRVAYSDADVSARAWLMEEMRGAGLTPRIDAAGNIFGRWSPENLAGPPILFGSHIDSVPSGGNFDGDLGTLAALGVIEACQLARVRLRHPLEMVLWAHEESTAFGRGTAASRIVAGDLQAGDLDQTWNGLRRADGIRRIGGDPSRIEEAVRRAAAWHAYFELHIEQGGTLERKGIPIGIVEGIVAIHRYDVTVSGFANHAGTTPMDERRDALVTAAQIVTAVRDTVTGRPGRQVGTVGRIEVTPNSPNVIPGQVVLSVEFRDLSERVLEDLAAVARERTAAIARDARTDITWRLASRNPPALAAPAMRQAIERASERVMLDATVLPSGAGHDAQMIAALCPMGMIFVPSIGGISHSPLERTTWDDCARGATVLLQAILDADERDTMA